MAALTGAAGAADRTLIALIADEDSTTGLLLAGIGNIDQHGKKNFFIVDSKTPTSEIEASFLEYTSERKDIAILLINQHIANKIRPIVDKYTQAFPALLEIPAKDHPYDPSKDSVLRRVQKLFGE
ncbi:putative VMA7-H+-ATPase V1 domain 14 kDa subunit, vacuolar [Tilletiaria anomala UBC 951]|uniref:V-type proton ATPase subunit F n=1 Tax=Tilletiaria anomala (strain ATCC 24038 / CBS 436.72 / UBC 951) TaxID=1037660 RepID=A0A066VHI4_TILAU|nr:putative VMA7-H+-ATPase V1 domain 14 kDa subunit, vacuolar [Tilletiaria anomala UBC 951]KDN38040.1 putative VMA7-H+-ATPase V1 domain 14 kDa subunit, vacuolar [Tilletiaria anomala UBC 951]